jgi:hypothetical protein
MSADMKMVVKGLKVPRDGLLDQARKSLEHEAKYRDQLATFGWTPDNLKVLQEMISIVESKRSEQVEARTTGKSATSIEDASITKVKAFKRQLILASNDPFFGLLRTLLLKSILYRYNCTHFYE